MDVLYKFRLPSADAQQVTVTLTPTQGDSDLYIKLGEGLRRFQAGVCVQLDRLLIDYWSLLDCYSGCFGGLLRATFDPCLPPILTNPSTYSPYKPMYVLLPS